MGSMCSQDFALCFVVFAFSRVVLRAPRPLNTSPADALTAARQDGVSQDLMNAMGQAKQTAQILTSKKK